jgi:hypothetical protein
MLSRSVGSKDVVPNNVQRNKDELPVCNGIDCNLSDDDRQAACCGIQEAEQKINSVFPLGQGAQECLLDEERDDHCSGKGPAKARTDGHPEYALSSAKASAPVHERCHAEHHKVHCKAGWQVRGTRMEEAG